MAWTIAFPWLRWIGARVQVFQLVSGRPVHDVCTGEIKEYLATANVSSAGLSALQYQRRSDVSSGGQAGSYSESRLASAARFFDASSEYSRRRSAWSYGARIPGTLTGEDTVADDWGPQGPAWFQSTGRDN